MVYKAKQTWKDLVEKCNGPQMTRRDLIARGLATSFLSTALPMELLTLLGSRAGAETLTCAAPSRPKGAIAQIFSEGGATMGARFISENQAGMMNATMAANYGITGTNLRKLGPNLVIDTTSPFGMAILQGPPGYTGGAAAWQANVLSKISGGGHLGQFSADDGAGENLGLLGGVSPLKISQMNKDIKVGVSAKVADWANGLPAASVTKGAFNAANLAKSFSLTPAAQGLTNATALNAATAAANEIAQSLASAFGTQERKGFSGLLQNAGCGFYGNVTIADPNFATSLFNAAAITELSSKLTVGNLSAQEQTFLSSFYQSASGTIGGVISQFNGRDYHGASPQNTIAPADIEEARTIVMFLAACEAAQAPGALIYTSNGQAIASGTTAVTATINGATVNMNAPTAEGDAGGAYNAGLIIFYDPKGAPPAAKFTGTIAANSGNAKIDGNVPSYKDAMAGLYLSALAWVNGGTIPQVALSKMRAVGVANVASQIMVV